MTILVGILPRTLDLLPDLVGLSAERTATAIRALEASIAVKRGVIALLSADDRRDTQRAIRAVFPALFGPEHGDPDGATPDDLRPIWAVYEHGGVGPFAAYDLDNHGRPPASAWRQRDSTRAGLGRVCPCCQDPRTIVSTIAELSDVYGFRPRRYVAKDGAGTIYIARQSWCKACRTTGGTTGAIADRRQVRERRIGSKDAGDLRDWVVDRARPNAR